MDVTEFEKLTDEELSRLTYKEFTNPHSKNIIERFAPFYRYVQIDKDNNLYPFARKIKNPSSAKFLVESFSTGKIKEMDNFGSNDYMGLANSPQLRKAASKAIQDFGVGAGAVPLFSGNTSPQVDLEKTIAHFYGREDAIVFSNGFGTNVGLVQGIMRTGDTLIVDKIDHASIHTGATTAVGQEFLLSLSNFNRSKNPFKLVRELYKVSNMVRLFKHENYDGMAKIVRQQQKKGFRPFIFTDGVYSMDGDIVNLPIILDTAKKHNALTAIDEAHALGVIGSTGKGTEEYFGIDPQNGVDVIMGTLSKSPGVIGGYITGTKETIQYIRHFAAPYIFSTSMPAAMAAACKEAFNIIRTDHERRQQLTKNWQYFKNELLTFKFKHERVQKMNDHLLRKIESAIIPVIIGRRYDVYNIVAMLQENGVFVNPVIYPAVRKDAARIRLSFMATHTKDQLDHALHMLSEALYKHDLIKKI